MAARNDREVGMFTFSAKEIAGFLNIAKRTVARRATDENWAYIEEQVRGGKIRKYQLAGLPADVRRKAIKPLILKASDRLLDVLEGPQMERAIRAFLWFAAGFFGKVIIDILNR